MFAHGNVIFASARTSGVCRFDDNYVRDSSGHVCRDAIMFMHLVHSPVAIEFRETLPLGRIRFVAEQQMIHILDVHIVVLKHPIQLGNQFRQRVGHFAVQQRFLQTSEGFRQRPQVLLLRGVRRRRRHISGHVLRTKNGVPQCSCTANRMECTQCTNKNWMRKSLCVYAIIRNSNEMLLQRPRERSTYYGWVDYLLSSVALCFVACVMIADRWERVCVFLSAVQSLNGTTVHNVALDHDLRSLQRHDCIC